MDHDEDNGLMGMAADAIAKEVLALTSSYGIRCTEPRVLADRANLLIWLFPAPVVARIPRLVQAFRRFPNRNLNVDVEMAQYLADHGLPVVEPSAELPRGPHRIKDGYCTFWQHYDLVDGDRDPAELAEGIAAMHGALRFYQGDLAGLGPLVDLQQGSERLEWTEAERRRLRENIVWFQDALTQVPQQPVHGDPHSGNALITTRGIRWTDFEDAWHGPVEWDLASALEGPTSVPPATWSPTFELCFRLRAMYRALWAQVLQPGPYTEIARARMLTPLDDS